LTRSYAHRAWATSLLNDTIGGCLDKAAARWPNHEAVVVCDQDVRMTFAELRHEADRLAAGLIALGLQPGDRVGLWSPNNIGWILSQYATAKAGLILVNKSWLSVGGTGIRFKEGRMPGVDHRAPVQDKRLYWYIAEVGTGTRPLRAGCLAVWAAAASDHSHPDVEYR
jgi:hypothetical protein